MKNCTPSRDRRPGRLGMLRPVRHRSVSAAAANGLWCLSLVDDALAFRRARRDVRGAQTKLLTGLIRRNAGTEFGRRWRFDAVRSAEDYRRRVPLSTYDDYQSDISRIMRGEQGVLTSDPVFLLEPTSGSTGPTKLIPYTRSLKAEFRRAIAPWVVDLFRRDPRLLSGKSYWSVSPVSRSSECSGAAVPIGFEDDSEYLGVVGRKLVQAALAVPTDVRFIEDMNAFRYVTLLFLLRCRSLSILSVWHPSFLTLLLKPLSEWADQLSGDIAAGRITPPTPVSAALMDRLQARLRPDPGRAREIRRHLCSGMDLEASASKLWPNLRLISCWADGNAAPYVPALAAALPNATVQAKGLVATEGVVSIPGHGRPGGLLAVRSHFFEFLPRGEVQGDNTLLAHELREGERYSVVITTGGGLYRYQTGDLVDVVGHVESCPLLRFAQKESHVSDRFGEKLNEEHVQQVLDSGLAEYNLSTDFVMLAFDDALGDSSYVLFVESRSATDLELRSLGSYAEAALRLNFHYRYCRDLGQLEGVRVFRLGAGAHETFTRHCRENGQRIGGIKPSPLNTQTGWTKIFSGALLKPIGRD